MPMEWKTACDYCDRPGPLVTLRLASRPDQPAIIEHRCHDCDARIERGEAPHKSGNCHTCGVIIPNCECAQNPEYLKDKALDAADAR